MGALFRGTWIIYKENSHNNKNIEWVVWWTPPHHLNRQLLIFLRLPFYVFAPRPGRLPKRYRVGEAVRWVDTTRYYWPEYEHQIKAEVELPTLKLGL